jgi:hypothetical protein
MPQLCPKKSERKTQVKAQVQIEKNSVETKNSERTGRPYTRQHMRLRKDSSERYQDVSFFVRDGQQTLPEGTHVVEIGFRVNRTGDLEAEFPILVAGEAKKAG